MEKSGQQNVIESDFTVRELVPLAARAYALRLNRASGDHFDYTAGQFALVGVRDKETNARHRRPLSFTSIPADRDVLEFGYEKRGYFTQALSKLVPGDAVSLRAPMGFFTVPEKADPLVMLAGGTGISPVLGMLRDCDARRRPNAVSVIYSCRSVDDLMFRSEITALAARHEDWDLRYTITHGVPEEGMEVGRIDASRIAQLVPDPKQPLYFLAGPPAMVQDLIRALVGLGVERDRILTEQYE